MDKLEIEQTETVAQCQGANEVDDGEGKQDFSFKKFKDVESLQKAYSSLESEFTKRSQRLKQLEGEKIQLLSELEQIRNSGDEDENFGEVAGENFFEKFPLAKSKLSQIDTNSFSELDFYSAYIDRLQNELKDLFLKLDDEDFMIGQIESTAIKDRIIKEFLSDIKNAKTNARLFTSGGESMVVPRKKPKSFEEAGLLSRGLFNKERFD